MFVGVTTEAVHAAIAGEVEFFRERGVQGTVAAGKESPPRLEAAGEVVRLD